MTALTRFRRERRPTTAISELQRGQVYDGEVTNVKGSSGHSIIELSAAVRVLETKVLEKEQQFRLTVSV